MSINTPIVLPVKRSLVWILGLSFTGASVLAGPIQNLVFTEVIKDVAVLDSVTKKSRPAKVGDFLVPPNILQTGAGSRAELVAEDKTVTRVGANTVFSVGANSRDVSLEKGSVLFHSPTGKGGGNIKSGGATASVLGTTLIVGSNPSGGFKTMLLEGKGQVTTSGTRPVTLNAGQLSFALPGQQPSSPLNFVLQSQVSSSKLIKGFSKPVASIAKIEAAVAKQQSKIASGDLGETGLAIGDRPDSAFKVDSTTVLVVQQQVQAAERIASGSELDERYRTAVAARLSLSEAASSGESLFFIDGGGRDLVTQYGLPKGIPGQVESDGNHSLLIASEIVFGPTGSEIFNPVPVEIPDDLAGAGVVALHGMTFERSLEFVGVSNLGQLLLSAGNTIAINPGVNLRADVPLFEIYAGGSSLTSDIHLNQNPVPETEVPVIEWDRVGLRNLYAESQTAALSGKIRLTAPSIHLTDSTIEAGQIELVADRTLRIEQRVLPLGFDGPAEVSLSGSEVNLMSRKGAVQLVNAGIVADQITIQAETNLTLSGVTASADAFSSKKRSWSALAKTGDLTMVGSNLELTESRTTDLSYLMTFWAPQGTVRIGDEDGPETLVPSKPVIVTKTVVTAQEVTINAAGDVVVRGLTVKAGDATKSKFTAESGGTMSLDNVSLNESQTVALSAQTVVLKNTHFKADSDVLLVSRLGSVAPNPGMNRAEDFRNGMVNFVRNNFYGLTEIKFSSDNAVIAGADFASTAASKGVNGLGKIVVRGPR